MGKNGRALREAKKQQTYSFTREQLEARDRALLEEQKSRIMAQMEKIAKQREDELTRKANEFLEKEWAEREELMRAGDQGLFENLISYLIAVPARVLIERFDWKPIRSDERYRKNMKIDRFCMYILEELNSIANDEYADIRTYAEEVFQKYGVKVEAVEVDE